MGSPVRVECQKEKKRERMCVRVCDRDRKRERERKVERQRKIEREGERRDRDGRNEGET